MIVQCNKFARQLFRTRWLSFAKEEWKNNTSGVKFWEKAKTIKDIKTQLKSVSQKKVVLEGKIEEWDISTLCMLLIEFDWIEKDDSAKKPVNNQVSQLLKI